MKTNSKHANTKNEMVCKDEHHQLLPTYLQDVLKRAVNPQAGEHRLESAAYVGQLDQAVQRVRESFPQAFYTTHF